MITSKISITCRFSLQRCLNLPHSTFVKGDLCVDYDVFYLPEFLYASDVLNRLNQVWNPTTSVITEATESIGEQQNLVLWL